MNSGMKVGLGRPDSGIRDLRVSPYYIQNIRNIEKTEEKPQQIQASTEENLFRLMENKRKQTGTNSGTQVLAMFRNPTFPTNLYSPSAMRPAADSPKSLFRLLPVAPEHFQGAESRELERPGKPAKGKSSDVPDVSRACAGFWFSAPICGPARCPPWPS